VSFVMAEAPSHSDCLSCPPTHVTRLLQCTAFSNQKEDGIELERHLTELEFVLFIHTACTHNQPIAYAARLLIPTAHRNGFLKKPSLVSSCSTCQHTTRTTSRAQ
jgi:hypothetical protein